MKDKNVPAIYINLLIINFPPPLAIIKMGTIIE